MDWKETKEKNVINDKIEIVRLNRLSCAFVQLLTSTVLKHLSLKAFLYNGTKTLRILSVGWVFRQAVVLRHGCFSGD